MPDPRPLTPEEKRWVKSARRLFARTPETLAFMTIGDPWLVVIDRALELGDLHDGEADRRGAVLASIDTNGAKVHGVSG